MAGEFGPQTPKCSMPPTDARDHAIVEHLARVVMGWGHIPYEEMWKVGPGYYREDIHLYSWADAGAVWEKARENRQTLLAIEEALLEKSTIEGYRELFWFLKYATPRRICEAAALATGFVWLKEEEKCS